MDRRSQYVRSKKRLKRAALAVVCLFMANSVFPSASFSSQDISVVQQIATLEAERRQWEMERQTEAQKITQNRDRLEKVKRELLSQIGEMKKKEADRTDSIKQREKSVEDREKALRQQMEEKSRLLDQERAMLEALRDQLASQKEQVSSPKSNETLPSKTAASQAGELGPQIQKMSRQIEIKDRRIAELRKALEGLQTSSDRKDQAYIQEVQTQAVELAQKEIVLKKIEERLLKERKTIDATKNQGPSAVASKTGTDESWAKEREMLAGKIQELKADLAQGLSEKKELQIKVSETKAALEKNNEGLRSAQAEDRRKIDVQKQQLADLVKDYKRRAKQLEVKETEIRQAQAELLDQSRQHSADAAGSQENQARLAAVVAGLERSKDAVLIQLKALEDEKNTWINSMAGIMSQLKQKGFDIETASRELTDRENQLRSKEESLQKSLAGKNDEKTVARYEAYLREIKKERTAVNEERKNIEAAKSGLSAQRQALADQIKLQEAAQNKFKTEQEALAAAQRRFAEDAEKSNRQVHEEMGKFNRDKIQFENDKKRISEERKQLDERKAAIALSEKQINENRQQLIPKMKNFEAQEARIRAMLQKLQLERKKSQGLKRGEILKTRQEMQKLEESRKRLILDAETMLKRRARERGAIQNGKRVFEAQKKEIENARLSFRQQETQWKIQSKQIEDREKRLVTIEESLNKALKKLEEEKTTWGKEQVRQKMDLMDKQMKIDQVREELLGHVRSLKEEKMRWDDLRASQARQLDLREQELAAEDKDLVARMEEFYRLRVAIDLRQNADKEKLDQRERTLEISVKNFASQKSESQRFREDFENKEAEMARLKQQLMSEKSNRVKAGKKMRSELRAYEKQIAGAASVKGDYDKEANQWKRFHRYITRDHVVIRQHFKKRIEKLKVRESGLVLRQKQMIENEKSLRRQEEKLGRASERLKIRKSQMIRYETKLKERRLALAAEKQKIEKIRAELMQQDQQINERESRFGRIRKRLAAQRDALKMRSEKIGREHEARIADVLKREKDAGRRRAEVESLQSLLEKNNAEFQNKMKSLHEKDQNQQVKELKLTTQHLEVNQELEGLGRRKQYLDRLRQMLNKKRQSLNKRIREFQNRTIEISVENPSAESKPDRSVQMLVNDLERTDEILKKQEQKLLGERQKLVGMIEAKAKSSDGMNRWPFQMLSAVQEISGAVLASSFRDAKGESSYSQMPSIFKGRANSSRG